jgi:hypothetical protein
MLELAHVSKVLVTLPVAHNDNRLLATRVYDAIVIPVPQLRLYMYRDYTLTAMRAANFRAQMEG